MLLDLFALLLQSAGGAIAGSSDMSQLDLSLKILQAGLSIHLVGIAVYVGISCDFAYSVYTNRWRWNSSFEQLQHSKRFLLFLTGKRLFVYTRFVKGADEGERVGNCNHLYIDTYSLSGG
jgi:hypothetical protein